MSPSYRRSAQLLVALCLLSFVLVVPWAPAERLVVPEQPRGAEVLVAETDEVPVAPV